MTKWAKQSNRAGWMLSALALASVLAACSKNEAAPVVASGASTAGVAGKAASASVNPALTVSTVMPETAAWPITVTANGSIAAWQEGIVGAFSFLGRTSGKVDSGGVEWIAADRSSRRHRMANGGAGDVGLMGCWEIRFVSDLATGAAAFSR